MNPPRQALRQCPTRMDARPVLLAHNVTVSICQTRQRELYHKCFSCLYSNALQGDKRQLAVIKQAEEIVPRARTQAG